MKLNNVFRMLYVIDVYKALPCCHDTKQYMCINDNREYAIICNNCERQGEPSTTEEQAYLNWNKALSNIEHLTDVCLCCDNYALYFSTDDDSTWSLMCERCGCKSDKHGMQTLPVAPALEFHRQIINTQLPPEFRICCGTSKPRYIQAPDETWFIVCPYCGADSGHCDSKESALIVWTKQHDIHEPEKD